MPPVNYRRVLACLAIGTSAAFCSWFLQTYASKRPGGDFSWSMQAARDLLKGRDPYSYPVHAHFIPYPLPAAFVGLPFSCFTPAIGAAIFYGISTALLAYSLATRSKNRLWVFLAMPFWFAMVWAQWTPMIMAAAFIPVLLPVVLIKPQIALPVALTHWSKAGIYTCLIVAVISLAVYPTWPLVWLSQIKSYQRFFPVLSLPFGPLLLLAVLRWRDPDAQLFLLIALFPQRHFYDAFTLWLIPKTKKEIIPTVALSWGAWIWKTQNPTMQSHEVGLVSVVFFFLPMLSVLLLRPYFTSIERETSKA